MKNINLKTKKRLILALLLLICMSVNNAFSQSIANYAVTRTTGNVYNSIASTGIPFDSWRNTTLYIFDDNRSEATEIGFDFWYNGERYTEFSASTNGYIDLSPSNAVILNGPYFYDNFHTPGGTTLGIAALFDDLMSKAGVDPLGASIKYLTTGTEPNRVLTVEWINMTIFGNITPDLNFQIKLYEGTDIIDINYGVMVNGTYTFSYASGINAATVSSIPTPAQLKMQQTANSATFSNTPQINLVTIPASNSSIRFTSTISSPVTSGTLSLLSITSNTMNLSWVDWCSNENNYAIYNSVNNINFEFVAEIPANSSSYSAINLYPGTTYYWKVFALAEGYLSNPLANNATTLNAVSKTTNGSGSWNNPLIWIPNGVPTIADNVIIGSSHTVIINNNAFCNDLTLSSSSTILIGDNTVPRNIIIREDLIINTNAQFEVNAFDAIHTLRLDGNLTNNGILDLNKSTTRNAVTTFFRAGNKSISGTGTSTIFGRIILNKGTSTTNVLTVNPTSFTVPSDFLTLSNGTFKYAITSAQNITPFGVFKEIPKKSGFTMSSSASTATFIGGVSLFGNLISESGIIEIGNAINQDLQSDGGLVQLTGGSINVAGKYFSTTPNTLSNFQQSAGIFQVATFGSTSTTQYPFDIQSVGSRYIVSGGSIIIVREGGTGGQDLGYRNINATSTVTGGTLQIGTSLTPITQRMGINSSAPVYNLLIDNVNATGSLLTNLIVQNDFTLSIGSFSTNARFMYLGGQWVHTGGTFTPGAGTIVFNGTGIQTIQRTLAETFYRLETDKISGFVTTTTDVIVSNTLTLTNGNYVINSNLLTLNGTMNPVGNGELEGSELSRLTIGGSGDFGILRFETSTRAKKSLLNLTINRITSGTVNLQSTDSLLLFGTLTMTNGTLNTNNKLVLVSNSLTTARIAVLPASGLISGNVIVQRFIPSRSNRRHRLLSSPVNTTGTGIKFDQFIDDINVSGPGGVANGFDFTTRNSPSIFLYNETVPGSVNLGYQGMSNINDDIFSGRGVFAQIRGDRNSPTLAAPLFYTAPFPAQTSVTMDFEGVVNRGDISPAISYTNTGSIANDGFNLVGNPYASQIDWKSGSWTRTNIDAAMYIYNPNTNSYGTYLRTSGTDFGTNGVGRYISSGQAFLIKANAANPVLTFREVLKSTGTPSQVFRTAAQDLVKITLVQDTSNSDEIIISFDSLNVMGYNENEDANKFFNQTLNISSRNSGGEDLAINGRPHFQNSDTVFLAVDATNIGIYELKLENFSTISPDLNIYLRDEFTQTNTDLRTISFYTFTISTDSNSKGRDRFKIISENSIALPVVLNSFTGRKEESKSLLTWSTSSEINFSSFDLERTDGVKPFEKLASVKAKNGVTSNYYTYSDLVPLNGINYYRLKMIDVNGRFIYSKLVSLNFDENRKFKANLFPNPTKSELNINFIYAKAKTCEITIVDAIGHIVLKKTISTQSGVGRENLEFLAKGQYIIKLISAEENFTTSFIKE